MQRRGAVQQHRVILDDLFEDVPNLRPHALHDPLGALDVVGVVALHQLPHHERLEQLQRHPLRQAALVQLQVRADHDDRAARVVHALAQQVLAEPPLLALQHVRERLQLVVAGAGHGPTAPTVVDQRVHRFLEHPLLVADDDLRGAQLKQPLEAVVPVDHPAVQIVQVRRGEPAAVQLHHRTQVGRKNRQDLHHHPLRLVAGLAERLDDAQALGRLLATLPRRRPGVHPQLLGQLLQINLLEQIPDRLGAHPGLEDTRPDQVEQLAVLRLVQRKQRLDALDPLDLEGIALALAVSVELGLAAANIERRGLHLGLDPVDLVVERLAARSSAAR